jgi:hypothetical protein
MDPEIFFLSVGMIGWELAIWRLAATLVLSLGAGFITHLLMQNGWLGQQILRTRKVSKVQSTAELFKKGWQALKNSFAPVVAQSRDRLQYTPVIAPLTSESTTTRKAGGLDFTAIGGKRQGREVPPIVENNAVETVDSRAKYPVWKTQSTAGCSSCSTISMPLESPRPASVDILNTPTPEDSCNSAINTFWQRLFKETLSATTMVIKFMALAFFLEALIILYVPPEWITAALGRHNPMAIATAAVLGVPTYTSSLAALPMISGLLTQGMNPAAALAFLIAGPITTLPAMAAVWPLVVRRVFVLYVSFALVGAIIIGYLKLIFG